LPWWEKRDRLDQAANDDLDGFVEARGGLLGWDLKAGELAVPVALADPEVEPAAGHQIERGRLFGEQDGVVPGKHHDSGAQPQPAGHGEAAQQHEGGRHLVPAREVMLDEEAGMEAKRLGLDVEVEVVPEPLAHLGGERVTVRIS